MSAHPRDLAGEVVDAINRELLPTGGRSPEDLQVMLETVYAVLQRHAEAKALAVPPALVTETLRDRFALACVASAARTALTDEAVAECAYRFADAMLAARNRAEDGGPSDARTANTRILAALGMLQRDEPNVEAARALLKDHAERILTPTAAGKEVLP